MLICPKCKTEYRDGYKICYNCKEELIEIPDTPEKNATTKEVSMKRTIIGIALLITSALAYVGIAISVAIYGSQLTEWMTDKGKVGTALTENAIFSIPCFVAAIMFAIGVVILFVEYFSKTDNE